MTDPTPASADGGRGRLRETHRAAIQHGLVDLPGDERLVGVVRRPTGWFRDAVDENVPELGPPDRLLDEFQGHKDDLKLRGMCDEGAHNATWEELDFEARYREYLADSAEARAALDRLVGLVAGGEDVVLVCYEGEDKRCHRRVLADVIERRLERRPEERATGDEREQRDG